MALAVCEVTRVGGDGILLLSHHLLVQQQQGSTALLPFPLEHALLGTILGCVSVDAEAARVLGTCTEVVAALVTRADVNLEEAAGEGDESETSHYHNQAIIASVSADILGQIRIFCCNHQEK